MSVAVVGFSIGYQSCYVSVARGGGIETVANEYSDRATPCVISFNNSSRSIGAAAKQQQITNISNTFYGFTKLIGKQFSDPAAQAELSQLPFKCRQLLNGQIGICCSSYLGEEEQIFTPEQLMGMQLTKLKEIAEINLRSKVIDIVLNVPACANDAERRAMIDATQIAGLNCIRLINDITAVGVAYGIYNKDFPPQDQASRIVAFVDFGASNFQIGIMAFNDGKMNVLSSVCDTNLGGRDFDRVIFNQFVEEAEKKYKLRVLTNPKASLRLLQECEKLKKLMSANSTRIPLGIECFMNDVDVAFDMDRTQFESLAESLFTRIDGLIRTSLTEAADTLKLPTIQVDAVEIVGGSSRMPRFKDLLGKIFGQDCRTSLNADEAVARGASLQCAILSPAFRVRDFVISDVCAHGISLVYQEPGKDGLPAPVTMEVFPRRHSFPASRQLTLNRSEDFTVEAVYSSGLGKIGAFTIRGVVPGTSGEPSQTRIKLRINVHGLFSVSQAQIVEKVEKHVPVEEEPAINTAPPATAAAGVSEVGEVDPSMAAEVSAEPSNPITSTTAAANNQATPQPPATRVKLVNKFTDLAVRTHTFFTNDRETVQEYLERENRMQAQDRLERERLSAKNAVEEYVYEMRDKLYGQYEQFATETERDDLGAELSRTEDWLYGEGEDLNKQSYVDRLAGLQTVGNRIRQRAVEAEHRPRVLEEFGRLLQWVSRALLSYQANEEAYCHIASDQMARLSQELSQRQEWFNRELNVQNARQACEDPTLTVDKLRAQMQGLEAVAKSILNTPKPKVEPPPSSQSTDNPTNNSTVNDNSQSDAAGLKKADKMNHESEKTNGRLPTDDMDID